MRSRRVRWPSGGSDSEFPSRAGRGVDGGENCCNPIVMMSRQGVSKPKPQMARLGLGDM